MENQTTQMDYVQSFAQDWATVITLAGPPLVILLIFIGIYLARKAHAKKISAITTDDSEDKSLGLGDGDGESQAASELDREIEDGRESDYGDDQLTDTSPQPTDKPLKQAVFEKQKDTDKISVPESKQPTVETPRSLSWLDRLRSGLAKTRGQLTSSIHSLFSGSTKIDEGLLDRIHEALYKSDMGVQTADLMIQQLKTQLVQGEEVTFEKVASLLKKQLVDIFKASQKSETSPTEGPRVILIIGVNGVGKTTTVGKLAAWHIKENKSVLLCAADTFRAAAIEQLSVWAERIGVQVIAHKQGADPAAVAFDGVKAAKARNMDAVIIDTAGRLHNKVELMAELGKVTKSIHKEIPGAPHETWIVVDATTGQNALLQVKAFHEVTPISGVIVTKLDGSAKGGIVVAIAHQFKLPIRFVGVGESSEDLRPFDGEEFASSLF